MRGHSPEVTDQHAPKRLPVPDVPIARELVGWVNQGRRRSWKYKNERAQMHESNRVYERIQRGDPDWLNDFM